MEDVIHTSDLNLAAYLKAQGVPFLGMDRRNGRVYFVYGAQYRDLVDHYYDSADGKYAQALLRAYRLVRGLVLDAKERAA